MRHLLAAAAVLMAGPAMAVDYVKCEAMQNAIARTMASLKQITEEVTIDTVNRFQMEACGVIPPGINAAAIDARLVYYGCLKKAEAALSDEISRINATDPRVQSLVTRASKIKADYQKADCY